MLQINSGKLFSRGIERTNHLRGVLYSNLELCYGYDVVTAAGSLLETDGPHQNRAIVYEIDERIEAQKSGPGVLISHTIEPFLTDFSAVATFGLRAIVSPDAEVVSRLVSASPGLASYRPPRHFVRRYFDDRVPLEENEIAPFATFVDELIALDRRTFLAAMGAIRTFVSGLHRMRDDLALAYTLFVSAIESLAQDFDGHTTAWIDVDERKRKPLDLALKAAPEAIGEAVRAALLSTEHVSLARRYRAFALSHIGPNYFREQGLIAGGAIARHELEEALRQAYVLRSRYIHNLQSLPDAITLAEGTREVAEHDRRPVLSFQGLVRLTRHVIRAFVAAGRKVDREPYNYTREQAGVVVVPFAAEVWVGAPLARASDARQRIEGLLEQLVPLLQGVSGARITDLRPLYPDIERLARSSRKHRASFLTLYALFAPIIGKEARSDSLQDMVGAHLGEIGSPSSEALVARTLFGTVDEWTIDAHRQTIEQYFAERVRPTGLHAPRALEAVFWLTLAERLRKERRHDEARTSLARAVEVFPGHAGVLVLEANYSSRKRIDWRSALLPSLMERRQRRSRAHATPPTG